MHTGSGAGQEARGARNRPAEPDGVPQPLPVRITAPTGLVSGKDRAQRDKPRASVGGEPPSGSIPDGCVQALRRNRLTELDDECVEEELESETRTGSAICLFHDATGVTEVIRNVQS